jgi:hypothetical protein
MLDNPGVGRCYSVPRMSYSRPLTQAYGHSMESSVGLSTRTSEATRMQDCSPKYKVRKRQVVVVAKTVRVNTPTNDGKNAKREALCQVVEVVLGLEPTELC